MAFNLINCPLSTANCQLTPEVLMDIGKIGDTPYNNKIDSVKNKADDDSFEKRLQGAVGKSDDKELRKVCKDFEGILLNMMYKQMKATVPKSDLIPSDAGKDIFDTMLDDKLMEEASKSGGLGLSDVLYKQLSKQLKSKSTANDEGVNGTADKK